VTDETCSRVIDADVAEVINAHARIIIDEMDSTAMTNEEWDEANKELERLYNMADELAKDTPNEKVLGDFEDLRYEFYREIEPTVVPEMRATIVKAWAVLKGEIITRALSEAASTTTTSTTGGPTSPTTGGTTGGTTTAAGGSGTTSTAGGSGGTA